MDAKLTALGAHEGRPILGIVWRAGQPLFVEAADPETLGVAA